MNKPEPILDLWLGRLVRAGFIVVPLAFCAVGVLMLLGWLA